ncbi:MAG: TetR/AcrR family transcriptional regulator [Bacilli bacterium]|nr:TetR/AcrR family transcriptional regulator [Bacilli bacterium]
MSDNNIREPKQKRAIEKIEKIIEAGFELISKNGYYNTNTAEIAKKAGVSTGILYQYFNDKYDILIAGLEKYGDSIFFPMLKNNDIKFDKNDFDSFINNIIKHYIHNHKISNVAHEEIMSMVHSDKLVAEYYYKRELEMTNSLKNILINNGLENNNLYEKVHIMIGLIDNLCHEVIYHKHNDMDYEIMTNLVIDNIKYLFKSDFN